MKLFKKELTKDQLLYGGFIVTFTILYGATAFVSWYHAITFFNIANAAWLSVILSFVAEIGQASALFSLLLTDNKKEWLTWFVMVILTMLQVIGNVDSSYAWIIAHGAGVDAFRKSILFWVQTENTDTFKIIIAWITGALLPVIALSMTALVAQNISLRTKKVKTALDEDDATLDVKKDEIKPEPIDAKDIISEVAKIRPTEEELNSIEAILGSKKPIEKVPPEVEINPNDILGRTEKEIKDNNDESIDKLEKESQIEEKINKDEVISEENEFEPLESPKPEVTKPADEIIPHYSDEEINKMFMDEYERKNINDDLDEEAERLTPEVGISSGPDENGPDGTIGQPGIQTLADNEQSEAIVTHNNGLVELSTEPVENLPEPVETAIESGPPQPDLISEDEKRKQEETAKAIEDERLEKIRTIARENLKKK
jgi:hypothetical protein